MTVHITAMTYQPKVEPVKRLECRQTTRIFNPENPFVVGDDILIHGWEGRPYRSPWNWRLPRMPLTQVVDMVAFRSCVAFWQNPLTGKPLSSQSCAISYYLWEDWIINELSRLDGIVPATGTEYKRVLEGFHAEFAESPAHFQILRW